MLVDALERDDSDIGLHSFDKGSDLIVEPNCASAAEGGREERLLRGNRGINPTVREGS